ncbi:MAG: hypothetical protein M3Q44_08160 [bacterium]|nr:hypothetical protein [bacterium]
MKEPLTIYFDTIPPIDPKTARTREVLSLLSLSVITSDRYGIEFIDDAVRGDANARIDFRIGERIWSVPIVRVVEAITGISPADIGDEIIKKRRYLSVASHNNNSPAGPMIYLMRPTFVAEVRDVASRYTNVTDSPGSAPITVRSIS